MFTAKMKRYLMLLAALGLVAIAAGGGSGTFASFDAVVSNNNNTFASGTLYLHDTNGSTTCGSESSSSNSNLGTPYTADNGCATLFTTTLPTGHTTLSAGITIAGGAISSLPINALSGTAVEVGDEIKVTDGGSNTQYFYATAAAAAGATSIAVASQTPNFDYTSGSAVTDDARFVSLQLKNAGTIDAGGISVALGTGGCKDGAATTTSTTLSSGVSASATSLPVAALTNGIPSGTTITIGSDTVTTSAAVNPGATSIPVSATPNAYSSGQTISWAVTFTGGTALCGSLPVEVVETDSSYRHDTGGAALGCAAFGSTVANYGCSFGATTLSGITTTANDLSLASGGSGNTGSQLDAGNSRYFVIGIQSPGSLTNGSQNEQAKFDLVWKITQA